MSITTTELIENLEKYLLLAETEDVFITSDGTVFSKLSSSNADRIRMAKSLLGVIPADITLEEALTERASRL